ncbi:MAG: low temperature requirement protein A [Micrococcales bacterium 70-64]|nr:low temperature requirement protein A [Leifsonia sp.]ODU63621.1 MAG: low temperature requirement protein A [Leifsonia sp. SCN 70-46]OJX85312.1 MAG: low temperature requirement protein A [Micrococcales bacterium 70-64]
MIGIRTRVRARDITENHRVSSPLELLFDLTFVVAISSLVTQLVHAVAEGHAAEVVGPFLMVFFAIWWAWNQFTWLASAYDNDDVPYRVLTMVQMGGVLVLAAGVPSAFAVQDFGAITLGYLIMRLGLLGTLIRTMVDDPESRPNAQRYVIGISLVQVGWLLRLFFVPNEYIVPAFIVLAVLELLVSPWADRAGSLAWHPHHIAERYGLFAIILLGESVLAVTVAVQEAIVEGVDASLVVVAVSGLVLLFTLWWLYFSEPAAEGLVRNRDKSYIWGYGHYAVYASLAAIGAGLEIGVKAVTHHTEIGDVAAGYAVAIPLAVFLLLLWLLHAPLGPVSIPPVATVIASAAILVAPLTAAGVGILGSTVLMTLITVALLIAAFARARRR